MAIADDRFPAVAVYGHGSMHRLPVHTNPGLEIVYISKGHLRWVVDDHVELIPPHSVFFSLPWQEHMSADEVEPGHEWHFVVLRLESLQPPPDGLLRFHPDLAVSEEEQRVLSELLLPTHRHTWRATESLAWLLPALVRELAKPGPLAHGLVQSLSHACLIELVRSIQRDERPPYDRSVLRIRKFLVELEEHCATNWTLASMAERCKLHRTRFSDLFKLLTGESPMEHLIRLRLKRARQLLRDTDTPITVIAHQCGFSSSQHFARHFKEEHSTTASQYRASKRALRPD